MLTQGIPPDWLLGPASAVLADLQAGKEIPGLRLVATVMDDDFNGLTLGLSERSSAMEDLPQLEDELDADQPAPPGVGGNWVPRTMRDPERLVHIADLLQGALAETVLAWGQARPQCPRHPHPATPVVRNDEAWWICPRDRDLLYRIARGEVPRSSPTP